MGLETCSCPFLMAFQQAKECCNCLPYYAHLKKKPTEIEIPEGLEGQGYIRTDQVKILDWKARNAIFICAMPDETVVAVSNIVETIIWGY